MLPITPRTNDNILIDRKFYRWHFQSNKVSLAYQSKGVPIKLYRRFFFYDHYLANGIIKDFSVGGVGFLCCQFLTKNIVIELPNGERIKCVKQHHFKVNEKLTFYGVSWHESVYNLVMPFLRNYSKQAYRPEKPSTPP